MSQSISQLIALVSKTHRAAAERVLSDIGLHAGQEFVLMALWERDGRTQADLARELRVSPPTINRMVARMARAGLIELRDSPKDSRFALAFLTATGHALRPDLERVWSNLDHQTLNGFDEARVTAFRQALNKVLANLS